MTGRAFVIGAAMGAGALVALRAGSIAPSVPAAWVPEIRAWVPDVILDVAATLAPMIEDATGAGPAPQEIVSMSAEQNVQAFLRMIRYAEGTDGLNGYMTLVGGALFSDYSDHPRQRITIQSGGRSITSTAAGAYQFLSGTWDDARRALGLPDFSPESQDAGAVWLIRRRGALDDVRAGRFADAVRKCAKEWASLPGSPYGQPVRTLAQVADVYQGAGGAIA